MNRLLLILPPLLFIGLAAMFFVQMRNGPQDLPSVFIDRPAPPVIAEALDGVPPLTDAMLRDGQVSVVNFWASWCPPCRAEHPTLLALSAEGVRVFGVNMLDKADAAQAFLDEGGNPFAAVAFDPKGRMRLDWGVTAPPETFILRPDGTVAYKFIGPLVGDDYQQRFRPELEKALAEAAN